MSEHMDVRIQGHSMWPTFCDGDVLRMMPILPDEPLVVGDVVLANHPLKPSVLVVKRILRIEEDGRLFLVGDQSDPTASEDSHNFGPVAQHAVQAKWSGVVERPDGVRTRDRRIKSPSLYLTTLQARLGLLPRLFNASRRIRTEAD